MKEKINKKLLISAFVVYLILIVWVIMFKCALPDAILGSYHPINPIGFNEVMGKYMELNLWERFIYDFVYRADSLNYMLKDLVLNVIVFIPMGIYLSLLQDNPKTSKSLLIACGISLFFELYQLFTAFGSYCYLDVIHNGYGCLLGILIYKFLIKHIKNENIPKTVNYINIGVLIIFIPVVIYAFASIGLNFDVIAYRYSHIKII